MFDGVYIGSRGVVYGGSDDGEGLSGQRVKLALTRASAGCSKLGGPAPGTLYNVPTSHQGDHAPCGDGGLHLTERAAH